MVFILWSIVSPALWETNDTTELCPQVAALYPTKHQAIYQDLVDTYFDTDSFKDYIIDTMSGAVKIETESYDNMDEVGTDPRWEKFTGFHNYLLETFPTIHSSLILTKVNTYGLVYHWQGSDNSLKPILMAAHQDVVPVHPDTVSDWTHPPYSGYFDGESLWGRGTMDDKSGLISLMTTVEALLQRDYKPTRTVVLAFGFDEESGGTYGAQHISKYLLSTYGENGFALIVDEGGGFSQSYGSTIASIGTGEKGSFNSRIDIASPGGHSSVPPPHTSIGMLAAILVEFESNPFEPRLARSSPVYDTIQCTAAHAKSIAPGLRKLIKKSAFCDGALRKLEKTLAEDINMRALFGTTQAIDIIQGGVKTNALPEQAYAIVNHRIATDRRVISRLVVASVASTQQRDVDLLKPLAQRFNLSYVAFGNPVTPRGEHAYGTLTLSTSSTLEPAPITPSDGAPYRILSGSVKATYDSHRNVEGSDGLVVSPGIMTGNTDTKYYWGLTEHIFRYGHWNAGNTTLLGHGVHTVNENIRVIDLIEIVKYYTTFLLNVDEATSL
ncbi:carboxypeptidase S [Stereum hirsutum FP-91666 SS1]|uniref:carboxypeptidase S n=1 Tax=Stereum hirsutum (strain FP-91666) TaxID=721885 RepID=UPI000440EFE0|nr:carboxypeptidase S [Stereum hirsutum FP-91666 SS1]EIM87292.1 carboxypeptidase S [Stereum hirsutum FP-91666 SS1]